MVEGDENREAYSRAHNALSAVLLPRIRTVRAILAKLNPFLAEGAVHTVRLDLRYERILP